MEDTASLLQGGSVVASDATSYSETQVAQTPSAVTHPIRRSLLGMNILFLGTAICEVVVQLSMYMYITASAQSVLVFFNGTLPSIFTTAIRIILGFVTVFQIENSSANKCIFTICSVLSILNFLQNGVLGGGLSVLGAIFSPSLNTLFYAFDDIAVFLLEIVLTASSLVLCVFNARMDSSTVSTATIKKNYILGLIILVTQLLVFLGGMVTLVAFGIWAIFGGFLALALLGNLLTVIFFLEINPILILIAEAVHLKTKSKIASSVITGLTLQSLITYSYFLVALVTSFFIGLASTSDPGSSILLIVTAIGSVIVLLLKVIPDLITFIPSLAIITSDE